MAGCPGQDGRQPQRQGGRAPAPHGQADSGTVSESGWLISSDGKRPVSLTRDERFAEQPMDDGGFHFWNAAGTFAFRFWGAGRNIG